MNYENESQRFSPLAVIFAELKWPVVKHARHKKNLRLSVNTQFHNVSARMIWV